MKPVKGYMDSLKDYCKKTDWQLLVFLLLFINVKILVKAIAILFIMLAGHIKHKRIWEQRVELPMFYFLAPAIAILNCIFYAGYGNSQYLLVFVTGMAFWLFCLLAVWQLKASVNHSTSEHIHNAVFLFFSLNVLVSAINLVSIMWETGEWNPYTYQGMFQKYFIGTGDYIKGISFDTSTTNAVINVFGIFYFLYRERHLSVLACMGVLLLTCSNVMNVVTVMVFLYCFLFRSNRVQKSIMVVCACMLVIFMAKITPQNTAYVFRGVQHILKYPMPKHQTRMDKPLEALPDSMLSDEGKKYKFAKAYLDSLHFTGNQHEKGFEIGQSPVSIYKPVMPVVNIHSAPFQHKPDSSQMRMQIIHLALQLGRDTGQGTSKETSGKMLAFEQTIDFFKKHPGKMLTGNGMGNFSSKLAFRVTGLGVAGGYPISQKYMHPDFKNNHLALFLDYFGKDSGFHSITNSPNSLYLQVFSEYGLAGMLSLFIGYLWFFAKRADEKSYALPLLLTLCATFFIDYWFEQLSIVALFELLLFVSFKDNPKKQPNVVE